MMQRYTIFLNKKQNSVFLPVHLLICAITHRSMTKSIKISVLWLLTICGFAAHSIYDVLPMFWGKNMAVVATDGNVDYAMSESSFQAHSH